MNTAEAIQRRSSTRGYTAQPLTDAEVEALVHAGLQAPTATNRQELHFTVLKGDNPLLREIMDSDYYYGAPLMIVIGAEQGFRWSAVDAGIAVENIALAAEELGLGSVIIGCIYDALRGEKSAYFEKALGFPEGYAYEIAIAVGHKATEKEPHTYDTAAQVTYL